MIKEAGATEVSIAALLQGPCLGPLHRILWVMEVSELLWWVHVVFL